MQTQDPPLDTKGGAPATQDGRVKRPLQVDMEIRGDMVEIVRCAQDDNGFLI
jgi:hypothetical protein